MPAGGRSGGGAEAPSRTGRSGTGRRRRLSARRSRSGEGWVSRVPAAAPSRSPAARGNARRQPLRGGPAERAGGRWGCPEARGAREAGRRSRHRSLRGPGGRGHGGPRRRGWGGGGARGRPCAPRGSRPSPPAGFRGDAAPAAAGRGGWRGCGREASDDARSRGVSGAGMSRARPSVRQRRPPSPSGTPRGAPADTGRVGEAGVLGPAGPGSSARPQAGAAARAGSPGPTGLVELPDRGSREDGPGPTKH